MIHHLNHQNHNGLEFFVRRPILLSHSKDSDEFRIFFLISAFFEPARVMPGALPVQVTTCQLFIDKLKITLTPKGRNSVSFGAFGVCRTRRVIPQFAAVA